MHIKLFQVNMDRDEDRLAFCSLDSVKREAGAIPASIYDKVFEGDIDCANLEETYMLFNRDDRPGAKVFRSMSVSDVIAVRDPETGAETYHFCDSVGFEVVAFDPEKTTDRTNKEPKTIRVVLVEPGQEAQLADVDPSLEGLYSAIKTDLIEAAYPFEDDSEACIVCDEEGKIKGRDLNRALRMDGDGEIYDIVAGTFIVCGCGGENFGSLTEEQQKKYLELYRWPERFFRADGEIQAVQIKPADRGDAR